MLFVKKSVKQHIAEIATLEKIVPLKKATMPQIMAAYSGALIFIFLLAALLGKVAQYFYLVYKYKSLIFNSILIFIGIFLVHKLKIFLSKVCYLGYRYRYNLI